MAESWYNAWVAMINLDCYGFQDIYDNDKEMWNTCVFLCIRCLGADPTRPPEPMKIQPNTYIKLTCAFRTTKE